MLIFDFNYSNFKCDLEIFAAAFFYADDMVLLAPSLRGLTTLLKICGDLFRVENALKLFTQSH